MIEKPILLGKVNKLNDIYTLMGHMGDVCRIDAMEYKILRLMDGFRTVKEIAELADVSEAYIEKIFWLYKGDKKLSVLSDWNRVGWCGNCNVHISGERCGICGRKIKKIVFSPPCDPIISFSKEQEFILYVLKEKYDINLPKESCFLINNGVQNNIFFWEVEYAGLLILRIDFYGVEPSLWKCNLLDQVENIDGKKECILNQEFIRKNIEAI